MLHLLPCHAKKNLAAVDGFFFYLAFLHSVVF